MIDRRPAIWLPPPNEWAEAAALFGASEPMPSIDDARDRAIELLDRAAAPGVPGVLVRCSLKVARAVAKEIGADLSQETGRASIAARLAEETTIPTRRVLGMSAGASKDSSSAWVGWALVRDIIAVDTGENVVEIIIGKTEAPFQRPA